MTNSPYKFAKVAWLIAGIAFAGALTGCAGYVPGRQTYWDLEVKSMCEADGGLVVHEVANFTKAQMAEFPVHRGSPWIPPENYSVSSPIFYRLEQARILGDGLYGVSRSRAYAIRRSDQKVLGTFTTYIRRGGDVPLTVSLDTAFLCPDSKRMHEEFAISSFVRVVD